MEYNYTNENKRYALDEACDLINEARVMLQRAMCLLENVCDIELCDSFRAEDIRSYESYANNVQIYRGIANFESISGVEGTNQTSEFTGETDYGRKFLDYKGMRFVQVGHAVGKNYIYR